LPAPVTVPVEVPVEESQGIDEEVLPTQEVRPLNILNDPINTEADTCPYPPPYSDDICFGSSEGITTWKQCVYKIVGESNLHWTCNCGADSVFDCAKRGY
jgi:hypothetical protein